MPRLVTADVDAAAAFVAQSLATATRRDGEAIDGVYAAAAQFAWLKVKQARTLDLVIPAEWAAAAAAGRSATCTSARAIPSTAAS